MVTNLKPAPRPPLHLLRKDYLLNLTKKPQEIKFPVKLKETSPIQKNAKVSFIAFEGIDGAGCETLSNLVANYLKRRAIKVLKLRYPDYRDEYGKLILSYLQGKKKLTKDKLFLTHFTNQLKDKEKISNSLRDGKFIVSDRYHASNIAYNCNNWHEIEKAVKIASVFRMPKPGLIFYLKINPETSIKRKLKEKGKLDINEKDQSKLSQAAETYDRLAKRNVWTQWFVIDANKPIEDVKKSVLNILQQYL